MEIQQAAQFRLIYDKSFDPTAGMQIKSSIDLAEFAETLYPEGSIFTEERVYVVGANTSNRVMGSMLISIGSDSQTIVDVKKVMRFILLSGSNTVFMIHNHPSGTLKPSNSDNLITKKIQKACSLFDIRFLDHIILAAGIGRNYYSYADEQKL